MSVKKIKCTFPINKQIAFFDLKSVCYDFHSYDCPHNYKEHASWTFENKNDRLKKKELF